VERRPAQRNGRSRDLELFGGAAEALVAHSEDETRWRRIAWPPKARVVSDEKMGRISTRDRATK
jgi:hypothetical protein